MRAKILIVDDESAIRQMVCLALSQSSYDCIEAADTAEALGLPFARTEVINADEAVMTELANRVRQRAGSLG